MMTNLTGKAKPCPMCGSTFILSETKGDDHFYTAYIQCGDCGLRGYKNFVTTKVNKAEGTDLVLKYWNTRAAESEENNNDES